MEYKSKPTQWFEDEAIHTAYKEEASALKAKYRAMFQKKHGKPSKSKK